MSITAIIPTIAKYITSGFDALPTSIGVTTLFLGSTMMNVSYIFFFIGIALFLPLIIFLLKNTIGAAPSIKEYLDIGYWFPIMTFICVYIIVNAGYLVAQSPDGSAPDYMIQARRSQAVFAMIYSLAFFGLAWWYNHTIRGESEVSKAVVSIVLGAGLSVAWYHILTACGMTKLTDIFGITSRLFNKPETPSPTVCYTVE